MERMRNTAIHMNKTHFNVSLLFFLFSICSLIFSSSSTTASTIPCSHTSCPMFANLDIDFQEHKKEIGPITLVTGGKTEVSSIMGWPRRILSGPGSTPPNCDNKCDQCTPCKPVLVSKPPGPGLMTEYYPEHWMCKCGDKYYIP